MNNARRVEAGESLQAWFVVSAGALLAITGLAKAFSAIGPARALDTADPLIGIPFRQLLLLVGLAELLIAFFCIFTDRRRFSLLAVAWISTNFLVYRLGLLFIGWHHPCGCMGSLAGVLHLSDKAADNIMKGVLACLLVGSYTILLCQWRRDRAAGAASAPSAAAA
jgi:hypothetical protein